MDFQLTPEHIQNGFLSENDFSAAAGFPVKVFALSDFPHYDTLAQQFTLSPQQLSERANAIYQALKDNGLTHPYGPFNSGNAKEAAGYAFAIVHGIAEQQTLNTIPWFRHFAAIREQGYEQAHREDSPLWWKSEFSTGKTEKDVLPGVLNENISVGEIHRMRAAFVLNRGQMAAKKYWAQDTKTPECLILNYPNDHAHNLHTDLHERRHFQQIKCQPTHVVPVFYVELDADMSADAILQQANAGRETINANLHSRYLQMLNSPSYCWFAASMEALKRKEMPKNFYETSQAVAEIRVRLALQLQYKNNSTFNSQSIQNGYATWSQFPNGKKQAKYMSIIVEQQSTWYDNYYNNIVCGKNPAMLYTNLRQLVDKRVFTDPFAEHLATKILEAAQYFNPHFIYADCNASQKILEECERDGRPAQRTFLQKMMASRIG